MSPPYSVPGQLDVGALVRHTRSGPLGFRVQRGVYSTVGMSRAFWGSPLQVPSLELEQGGLKVEPPGAEVERSSVQSWRSVCPGG